MFIIFDGLVFVHLIAMAALVGSYLSSSRSPWVVPGIVHGSLAALVTGIAMVVLMAAGLVDEGEELEWPKVVVKLGIALVVAGLAWFNRKRTDDVNPVVFHAIGVLAILNVFVAVFWP